MTLFPGRAGLRQLVEWGYPKGSRRPTPDPKKAFSVVHITANIATAERELAWRASDAKDQNSATFFVNRDGSVWQALSDPLHMDPWANGDVKSPDTSNPRIAALVRDGVNANERTLVAIENVGNEIAWGTVPGGYPITPAQEAANAKILAFYHGLLGMPVDRETVIGHYQLNSVTRQNCPARDKSILNRIVAMANPPEDDMPTPLREYVPELWTAGPSGADLREQIGGPIVAKIAAGTPVFTVGQSTDGRWRDVVAQEPGGSKQRLYFAPRGQLIPKVQGRDPLLMGGIDTVVGLRLDGKPVTFGDPALAEKVLDLETRVAAAKAALGA